MSRKPNFSATWKVLKSKTADLDELLLHEDELETENEDLQKQISDLKAKHAQEIEKLNQDLVKLKQELEEAKKVKKPQVKHKKVMVYPAAREITCQTESTSFSKDVATQSSQLSDPHRSQPLLPTITESPPTPVVTEPKLPSSPKKSFGGRNPTQVAIPFFGGGNSGNVNFFGMSSLFKPQRQGPIAKFTKESSLVTDPPIPNPQPRLPPDVAYQHDVAMEHASSYTFKPENSRNNKSKSAQKDKDATRKASKAVMDEQRRRWNQASKSQNISEEPPPSKPQTPRKEVTRNKSPKKAVLPVPEMDSFEPELEEEEIMEPVKKKRKKVAPGTPETEEEQAPKTPRQPPKTPKTPKPSTSGKKFNTPQSAKQGASSSSSPSGSEPTTPKAGAARIMNPPASGFIKLGGPTKARLATMNLSNKAIKAALAARRATPKSSPNLPKPPAPKQTPPAATGPKRSTFGRLPASLLGEPTRNKTEKVMTSSTPVIEDPQRRPGTSGPKVRTSRVTSQDTEQPKMTMPKPSDKQKVESKNQSSASVSRDEEPMEYEFPEPKTPEGTPPSGSSSPDYAPKDEESEEPTMATPETPKPDVPQKSPTVQVTPNLPNVDFTKMPPPPVTTMPTSSTPKINESPFLPDVDFSKVPPPIPGPSNAASPSVDYTKMPPPIPGPSTAISPSVDYTKMPPPVFATPPTQDDANSSFDFGSNKTFLEVSYDLFLKDKAGKADYLRQKMKETKEDAYLRDVNAKLIKVQLGRLWGKASPTEFGNIVKQFCKPEFAGKQQKMFFDALFKAIVSEKRKDNYDPPAEGGQSFPAITNLQMKVTSLLHTLQGKPFMENILKDFALYMYYSLFQQGSIHKMSMSQTVNCARVYLTSLRMLGDETRFRLFLFDIHYFKFARAHAMTLVAIEVWPQILNWVGSEVLRLEKPTNQLNPHCRESELYHYKNPLLMKVDPLLETLYWVITNTGPPCSPKESLVFEARNRLNEVCGVPSAQYMSTDLVRKLLSFFVNYGTEDVRVREGVTQALLLVSRTQDFTWTHSHIVNLLVEILGKCFKEGYETDKGKITLNWAIETIGLMSRVYPAGGRDDLVQLFEPISKVLKKGGLSGELEATCVLALLRVGHHLQMQVVRFFSEEWKPSHKLPAKVAKTIADFLGTRADRFSLNTMEYQRKRKVFEAKKRALNPNNGQNAGSQKKKKKNKKRSKGTKSTNGEGDEQV